MSKPAPTLPKPKTARRPTPAEKAARAWLAAMLKAKSERPANGR